MTKNAYFDLHCDTLTHNFDWKKELKDTLNVSSNIISVDNMPSSRHFGQFFAIFVPDEIRGEEATEYFFKNARNFQRQCDKFQDKLQQCKNYSEILKAYNNNKAAAVLTIEGGAAFGGRLENIEKARSLGVSACTLTWNGENEIASGNVTDKGLSSFGKECVKELEKNNIIVDVSHLNDRGFYDVLKTNKRPFIATHSNARAITNHKRNLTDDQIKEIINMGGLIGLNYCIDFLNNDRNKACMQDLLNHALHILELGGENVLCLGSDFDGCTVFEDLNSLQKSFDLGDFWVKNGISKEICEKIMSQNALNFFKEYFKNDL